MANTHKHISEFNNLTVTVLKESIGRKKKKDVNMTYQSVQLNLLVVWRFSQNRQCFHTWSGRYGARGFLDAWKGFQDGPA